MNTDELEAQQGEEEEEEEEEGQDGEGWEDDYEEGGEENVGYYEQNEREDGGDEQRDQPLDSQDEIDHYSAGIHIQECALFKLTTSLDINIPVIYWNTRIVFFRF